MKINFHPIQFVIITLFFMKKYFPITLMNQLLYLKWVLVFQHVWEWDLGQVDQDLGGRDNFEVAAS